MSETIDYWGNITGFKKEEKQEILDWCAEFQDSETDSYPDEINFSVGSGWRGGGMSCQEIIESHFDELVKKKPHLKIEVYCKYVEHAPCEKITITKDGTGTEMID